MKQTERILLEDQAKLYRNMLEEVPGNATIIRGLMNISKVLNDRKSEKQYRKMLEMGKQAHREWLQSTEHGRTRLEALDRHSKLPKKVLKQKGLSDFNSDYERFTKLDINDSEDHMYLANELLVSGHGNAAQVCCYIALDLLHGAEQSFFEMFDEVYPEDTSDEAVRMLKLGTGALPDSSDIYSQLAWVHILREEEDEAFESSKMALKIAPADQDCIIGHCVASLLKGRTVEPEIFYKMLPDKHTDEAIKLAWLIKNRIDRVKPEVDLRGELIVFAEDYLRNVLVRKYVASGAPNAEEVAARASRDYFNRVIELNLSPEEGEMLMKYLNGEVEEFDA